MTQRSTSPQLLQATSPDVPLALFGAVAALLLVLVLITVQTGAGIGLA